MRPKMNRVGSTEKHEVRVRDYKDVDLILGACLWPLSAAQNRRERVGEAGAALAGLGSQRHWSNTRFRSVRRG